MMKMPKPLLYVALALLAPVVLAHEGHGTPGTVSHDLQHQLWNFAALVLVGTLLLAGDSVVALLRRAVVRSRRDRRPEEE